MTKRLRLPILLILLTAFAVVLLASCTSVGVLSVQVKEYEDGTVPYKTDYVIGEELDLTGLELVVTRTDGEVYTVKATDVRNDLKVLNFNTEKVGEFAIVLEYKGVSTSLVINVRTPEDAAIKYTVTFVTGQNATAIEPISVGNIAKIPTPDTPTRDGYVFDGWYKSKDYNELWNFQTDSVVGDTTLYAKWAKLYSITFIDEINGVSDIVKYVKEGATLTDIPAVPHREGENGSWVEKNPDGSVSIRESFVNIWSNVTVYANYEVAKYKVVFYRMQTDGITQFELKVFDDVPHGTNLAVEFADEIAAIDVQSPDPHKHFFKWSLDYTNIVSDLNICALYEINTYDVYFHLGYDAEEPIFAIAEDITYNNPVTRPQENPSRAGYAFDGWFASQKVENADDSDDIAWNFNTDRIKKETTLYARWTKIHTVKFLVDSSITLQESVEDKETITIDEIEYIVWHTAEVRDGAGVARPTLPTREGYDAIWDVEDATLQKVSQDFVVEAAFVIKKFKVTFYNHDRTVIKLNPDDLTDYQEVEFGGKAVAPQEPTREGYTFKDWGDVNYEYVTSDLEVTAVFTPNTYKVYVYPNNGLDRQAIDVVFDSRIDADKLAFQYANYHFDGWYTENTYLEEDKWNVNSDTLKVVGDGALILYAKWRKIHNVSFYNGLAQIATEKVVDGEIITTIPQISDLEGHTGTWHKRNEDNSVESTEFNFETAITEDTIIQVVYTINRYIVNFYKDLGQIHHTMEVEYGNNVANMVQIDDPVLEGRTFLSWDKPLDYTITQATDFNAIYSINVYTITWGEGSGITTQVEYGKTAVFPADKEAPTQEGKNLQGWRVVSPLSDANGNPYTIEYVRTDMVVAPVWVDQKFSVEFRDRENNVYPQQVGLDKLDSQTLSYGQFVDINTLVPVSQTAKEGKDFLGWSVGTLNIKYDADSACWIYDNANGTNAGVYQVGDGAVASLIIKGNEVYYSTMAVATLGNQINRNWNTIEKVRLYPTADGWKLDEASDDVITDLTSIAFSGNVFYAIQAETIFVARHETSTFTISYVTNYSASLENDIYEYNSLSVAPEIGVRESYVFLGWYLDSSFDTKYTFGTPVTSDITLYAKWEASYNGTVGLDYALNETGTAYSVTGFTAGYNTSNTEIIVPNYRYGLPVDSIGAEAFADTTKNFNIQKISLPNTLINIGPSAFMNMRALTEITIPELVTIIPDNAFSGAIALETVTFGDKSSVVTIGKNAFARNTSLKYSVVNGQKTTFTLPSTLETIESGAFFNCLALTEIYIPQNVTAIGDNAFAGANNLRYAVFSKNAPANLGANVFQNNTSLQKAFRIYVPNVASYTGPAGNANWKLLNDKICDVNLISLDGKWSYKLGTDGYIILVQYLGTDSELEIPEDLTVSIGNNIRVSTIGDYCFDSTVNSIEMLSSIAISQYTFDSADNLKKLIISVTDSNAINSSYIYDAYTKVASLDTLAISPSITISELFGGAAPTALTNVETLDTHNTIIAGFLANCVYVQNVTINGTIREIGDNAFLNCTALIKVTFDNSKKENLTTIGANAFNGAISLATFEVNGGESDGKELPNSVTTIGQGAFDGTKWLSVNSSDMVIVGNGILYRYRGSEAVVMIPETVTSITPAAFKNNTSLRQVYVQNPASAKLTIIGESAFENCVNLESLVLPASIEILSNRSFAGDTKLATIVLFGDVLPNLYGSNQAGTHVFSDARSNINFYVNNTANISTWPSTYKFVQVDNLVLFDGESADQKWVYSDAISSTGIMLIKSLTAGQTLTVPENLNNKGVYEIADYALPRTLTSLGYSSRILNTGDSAFAGVTFLEELTIYNNANANHRVQPSAMMSLLTQNSGISILNTVSSIAISNLIGGILPENIKTVNILQTESTIVNSFLENNQYVENITVTIDGTIYNLEETEDIASATITSIGAKAFRNTKWMADLDSEFVVVLGGNLVDYKGKNSILEIGDNVTEINGSIFENDEFIEIVYVPASVKKVGNKAFYGASKLTKVFFEGTDVPSLALQSFDANQINDDGMQVYVPASEHGSYINATNWSSVKPISDSGIVHIKQKASEKATATTKKIVYNEYIVNLTSKQMLLSRVYTENYTIESGVETLQDIVETTDISVPSTITYEGTEYAVSSLGNNVFMSSVSDVSISLLATINKHTFTNLGDIDTITIRDINIAGRQISSDDLINIFKTHSVREIAYDGSVLLNDLLGDSTKYTSLSAVSIVDGVTETVDEMLIDWSNISEIAFPQSIKKVGINSLEDTAWYKNYNSSTYGEFVVLGGSLLYKYKGSAGGTIRVPDQVLIVNTGAFSNYDGANWKSNVGAYEISFSLENSKAHSIYDYAFAGCKKLTNVTLPSSMRIISPNAFEGTQIVAENDMLQVSGTDAIEGITLIKYYGTAEEFIIPSKIKKIAAGAFAGNEYIKKFRYDYNTDSILTTICEDAFNGAVNLETVSLPTTLVNVGKDAFFNTKWLAAALASGKDVTLGTISKTILYQKNTIGSSYTLTSNIISVTEDALVAMTKSFVIDGVTYGATNPGITVTNLNIASGAKISQQEMYSIMSKVESVRTNGQVKLSTLIGSDEPLDNIKTLSFFNDKSINSITAEYAYGWSSVENVDTIPYYITSIGERAFAGTAWYENLSSKNGIVYAGGDSGSGVIIKYTGTAEDIVINYATGISADAFSGNKNIKSITFGANVTLTDIPANCFKDCENLANIVFSDSIAKYGEDAFENTAWLRNYDNDFLIMDGTLIAYKGEGGAIVIPEEVKAINSYVFSGNDTITSITFDTNCVIDTIGANWFRDCVNLEEIILNEYITHIERSALEGTKWLSLVSVGANPALYYEDTYFGIKRIVLYVGTANTFRVPSDVTEIMPTAFSGVTSLSQLIFVEGKLTEIPAGAFEGCTSLSLVTLVDNITHIGDNAFAGTPWLIKQTASDFVVLNGKLVRYNGTSTNVVLPEGISAINKGVFDGKQIVSLDMSATTIESIVEDAFSGLETLANVVFSDYTIYIGAGAFSGTAWLNAQTDDFVIVNDVALVAHNGSDSTVDIPSTVRYINSDVFAGNAYIDTVFINGEIDIAERAFVGTSLYQLIGDQYIQSIGKDAFLGTDYERANLNGVAPDGEEQTDNIFLVVGGHLVKFEYHNPEVVLPKDVTHIPEGIFTGNENITSIDFSKVTGALTIEENAFRNALNLRDITFTDKIDYIGKRAFYNTKWQNGNTDDLIVTASGKLLAYIAEGTTVKIPATVQSFAKDVFKGNRNITSIEFAQGAGVDIPEEAFKDCISLTNITFPRVAFNVGKNAFANTQWLAKQGAYVVVNGMLIEYKGTSTDILIPSTVTYIYDYVFKGNEQITSLAFANGTNIASIKGETFVGCSNLKDVTFRSTLETLDMGAFEGTAWKTNLQGTTDFVTVGTKILAYIGTSGEVLIPGGIDTIAQGAFVGNTTITSVSFEAVPEFYVIPAGVFAGCTNLATVKFPEYIEGIGKDAFKDTAWLNNLKKDTTFTGELESCFIIDGKFLFYAGNTTSSIFLPSAVQHISATAFEGMSIGDLYIVATDPSAITIAEGALDNVRRIMIPAEYIDAFRTAPGWSNYALKMSDGSN